MPLVACVICLLATNKNYRDIITFGITIVTFLSVLFAVLASIDAPEPIDFAYSVIAFEIEPLGAMFALLASGLWIVTHIYAVGYMRGNNEKNQNRFFACFAFSIFATIAIAFADNLITLFIFYELLTLGTYPLVTHKQNDEAKKSGRLYLAIVMGASVVFFLPAIAWTFTITGGNIEFEPGGLIEPFAGMSALLALFVFGLAKGAIMPMHRWLPAAMVAPTPVSALLHAVAVVKAGVFSILKVAIYVFGLETLGQADGIIALAMLAAVSIIFASVIAMTKDDLKARLAYSTVSQLAYVALGLAMATTLGIVGAALHMVTHGFGKITLFMCAGNIYTATHKKKISQMVGLGHAMPITFIAFAVGALSIIGLPPLAGAWSKWTLMSGAAIAQQPMVLAVLAVSTLLNIAYLVPVFTKGFFNDNKNTKVKRNEAPLLCVIPPCITAIACVVVFVYANDIAQFLMPIVAEIDNR